MKGLRGFLTWRRFGVAAAVTPVITWWLERLAALPREGWFRPSSAFHLGGDLRTFHTAAYLAVHGKGSIVYDPEIFRSALSTNGGSYGPFVNPPPFLTLFSPFGWVSFETAWFVMAGFAVIAIAASVRLLGVEHVFPVTAVALAFPPVYFAITFGQPSVLWVLILAGTYWLLRREKYILAGLVAGLLVMKPSIAIGIAIWWLIRWKEYKRATVAAIAGGAGYLGISAILFPTVFSAYLGSFFRLLGEPEFPSPQWAQFAPLSSWRLLFPDRPGWALVFGIVSVALAFGLLVPILLRSRRLATSFAVAVLLTLVVTPYLIAYDWSLLIVPAVVLGRRGGERSARLDGAMLLVAISSAWSIMFVNTMLDGGRPALQIAPVALLVAIAVARGDLLRQAVPQPVAA